MNPFAPQKSHAFALANAGRFAEALPLYVELCAAAPEDVESWYLHGAVLDQLGRRNEALLVMRRVLALKPQRPDWLNHIGSVMELSGDLTAAEECYRQALAFQPVHPAVRYNLGNVLNKLNRNEEALGHLRAASQAFPSEPRVYYGLGVALRALGQLPEAIKAFRQAITLNPRYADAHHMLGMALQESGDRAGALTAHEVALRADPNHADALNSMGVLLTAHSRAAEAEGYLLRALQRKPDEPGILFNLAAAYRSLQQKDKAIETYRAVLQRKPDMVEARYALAALGVEEAPPQSPSEYVKGLFDDYADRFDKALVEGLGYHIPELLSFIVRRVLPEDRTALDILDLGCGTGLGGKQFQDIAGHLVGVDLAPKMVEKARLLGIYHELMVGDVLQPLEGANEGYDLIIATDVFVYIGDLANVFAGCRKALRPGGLFAFSTEAEEQTDNFVLRQTGRYAHALAYIRRLAVAHSLEVISCESATVRMEAGKPLAGNIFVLRRE